jgi:uncharacterized protein YndB with AHSA1/START domain
MTSLRTSRMLPATVDRVWAALTEPDVLTAWFWPARLNPRVTVDLRAGGAWRIESTGPAVGGRYAEVSASHRLALTWQWDGEPAVSTVTIGLVARGDGTELTVAHDGLDDDEDRDNHVTGWNDCLDRLAALLQAPLTPSIA